MVNHFFLFEGCSCISKQILSYCNLCFVINTVYNFSHRIDQLSFGTYIPGYVYPLDGDMMVANKSKWLVLNIFNDSKWFEPRSISSSCSVIVRVSVVLKRTVGDSDCHQQFFSELHSPGRSHYTNYI